MEIKKAAQAGTYESNDVYVQLFENPNHTIDIQLTSVVIKQFGEHIHQVIQKTLKQFDITSCIIVVEDKGALDHVLAARIESAILRSLS